MVVKEFLQLLIILEKYSRAAWSPPWDYYMHLINNPSSISFCFKWHYWLGVFGSILLFVSKSLPGLCFLEIHEAQASIRLPLAARILTVLISGGSQRKPDMKTDGKTERHESCCQWYTLFIKTPRMELGACLRGLFELLVLFTWSICL